MLGKNIIRAPCCSANRPPEWEIVDNNQIWLCFAWFSTRRLQTLHSTMKAVKPRWPHFILLQFRVPWTGFKLANRKVKRRVLSALSHRNSFSVPEHNEVHSYLSVARNLSAITGGGFVSPTPTPTTLLSEGLWKHRRRTLAGTGQHLQPGQARRLQADGGAGGLDGEEGLRRVQQLPHRVRGRRLPAAAGHLPGQCRRLLQQPQRQTVHHAGPRPWRLLRWVHRLSPP